MGLGLSAMLVPLGSTMIAVALPAIGADFSRTPGELTQWLVNSYLMINIVALGPGGKLGDHWGYRNTLRLGQWMFGAGCLLPIVFHHFEALVASRVLMALGGAMMVPTVMAVFKITVPAERRHRVFGYFGAHDGLRGRSRPVAGRPAGASLWLGRHLPDEPAAAGAFGFLLRRLLQGQTAGEIRRESSGSTGPARC